MKLDSTGEIRTKRITEETLLSVMRSTLTLYAPMDDSVDFESGFEHGVRTFYGLLLDEINGV